VLDTFSVSSMRSTRFATVTPIQRKSLGLQCFKEFKVLFETQYETAIKSIHSDNGGEYTPVERYAKSKGIEVTRSAPYVPQSNGIEERMNRTILEAVRTTLAQSGLKTSF
jgi:transposase InsO family protein